MPRRCENLYLKSLSWLSGLLVICLSISAHASSNQCLEYLPDNITSTSDVRVCSSSFNGIASDYICRDYVAGNVNYRILYKGGLVPKAILKFDELNHKHLVWSPLFGDPELRCPLAPPEGVPQHATHRGIGVCHDGQDHTVPCSVYEHAAARSTEAYRYLAIYDANGDAAVNVNKFPAGKNIYAFEAEFSYQIGISLVNSDCCRAQGLEYIRHAYELFPQADAYRVAYFRNKGLLASN